MDNQTKTPVRQFVSHELPFSFQRPVVRYGIAVISVALAVLVRAALDPFLGDSLPLPAFFLAVLATSWFGGFGSSLLCAVLGYLAVDWFFLPPRHAFSFGAITDWVGISSYSLVAIPIVLFGYGKSRVEQAQRGERDILQSVMNSAKRFHLVYLDRDFNFVLVNETYARHNGYKPEEMVGKNHFALYPHKENEAIFTRVRDTGVPVEFHDKPFVFPDHPERGVTYWDWTLVPVKDEQGQVKGLVFSLLETTERKRLEDELRERETLLKALSENTEDAIYIKNTDSVLVFINRAILRIVGKPAEAIIGHTDAEFYDDPAIGKAILENDKKIMSSGEPQVFEETVDTPKGRRIMLSSKVTWRDENGRIIGIMGISRDITERKKAEDIVRRDKEIFEKLVREAVAKLMKTERELDKARRLSDIGTLASTVAHELRNPLAAITMAHHNLKKRAGDPQLSRHLSTIEKKVAESDQIINNLLFYSKLKLPHFEPMPIFKAIKESVQLLRAVVPDRVSIKLEADALQDTVIEADPLQVKEVLSNILNNAADAVIKTEQGRIEITGSEDKGKVTLQIRDNGAGMSKETARRAMEPFYSTKSKGTGLGLTVSRQIVELHSGTINLESEPGKGTTVTISLLKKKGGGE